MPDTPDELRGHCKVMIRLLAKGLLIPFFGAGANLTNRPANATFKPNDKKYLPTAEELSIDMAQTFDYPWERPWEPDRQPSNLLRVSWYTFAKVGRTPLYQYLHEVFSGDYPPTDAHRFFASLPQKLEKKGYGRRHQLILTTNYDDLLERACQEAGEPYDVLSYVTNGGAEAPNDVTADKRKARKFKYTPYSGDSSIVAVANEFIPESGRTTILKIHGAVDHSGWENSSFVITEDDYLDYLSHMNNNEMFEIPSTLMAMMQKKAFLFLGYSLGDWNLRVLLNGINQSRRFENQSWAIMKEPKEWDADYWDHHNVQLQTLPLDKYIQALEEQLDILPVVG